MERRIENGVTIIYTGDAVGGLKNKHGHTGIYYCNNNNRYRAEITYRQKKYLLCVSADIEDTIAVRKEAENQVKNGTFMEWYHTLKKKGK